MLKRSVALLALAAAVVLVSVSAGSAAKPDPGLAVLAKVKHIVVIYEENHSFDNLYGGWESVDGLPSALAFPPQMSQSGARFDCLLQQDVNLVVPPLSSTCSDTTANGTAFSGHFPSASFKIDDVIPATAKTCPAPGAFASNGFLAGNALTGGCTRDIVHRYYQEQ